MELKGFAYRYRVLYRLGIAWFLSSMQYALCGIYGETTMFVYFVQAGKRGAIKIGIARNIERRILSMQTGNAYELHLLAAIPCKSRAQAKDFEGRLHRFFGRQKIRGEWFMNNINVKKAVDRFSETINPIHMTAIEKEAMQ